LALYGNSQIARQIKGSLIRRQLSILLYLAITSFLSIEGLHAGDPLPRNIRIDVQIESVGFEAHSVTGVTRFKSKTQQFITTLEGHEGTIFVGKRIPEVMPLHRYLVEHGYIEDVVVFRDVGTKLKVLPRIRGNMIEIEVTPEISYQTADDTRNQVIRIQHLSSTVMVPNGQTIQLGASATASEFESLFYRKETGEQQVIYLTPHIL